MPTTNPLVLGKAYEPGSPYSTYFHGAIDEPCIYNCALSADEVCELYSACPPPTLLGDMNCDGQVTFDDIDPFVLALGGCAGYHAQYPDCNWYNGNSNEDGRVNFDDINPFVALLSG